MGSRACHDCGELRPLAEFAKSRECAGGLGWQCKACRAIRWQKYATAKRAERLARPRPQPPAGVWKDFSPIHAISDDGRVWSYKFGRLLAGVMSRDGYRKLPFNGKAVFIHRIVAEAFVPGSGEQVRHINGDKLDNRAVNLEWGTCQENILDKWKHGKMVVGEKHHNNRIPEAEIPAIRASKETNTALAAKYGVSRTAIYWIKKGTNYGWL